MKISIKILILGILIFTSSCNNSSKQTPKKAKLELKSKNYDAKPEDISYDTKPENILKDFMTWYNYDYYNIHLAQDFVALDTNSTLLNKTQFLNKLLTGQFLAIKIALKDRIPTYKLFRLTSKHSDIASTIMQLASSEISNYKMEGKKLPDFNFTDLNGNVYNRATTKGKILILKCWFIHCKVCVQEFPELNQLVNEYKQNKNIIFLSLASDNKNDLIDFLKKKQFNYAVIPNLDMKYMEQYFGAHQYPTHLFVDQNGTIQKVVNSADDLIAFLGKVKLENLPK
jgi:cytochrome oxidase Cu insertion factor (SCO1/SenC/PrrC family)